MRRLNSQRSLLNFKHHLSDQGDENSQGNFFLTDMTIEENPNENSRGNGTAQRTKERQVKKSASESVITKPLKKIAKPKDTAEVSKNDFNRQ